MLATLLIWLSVAVAVLALADLFLSQAQKTWLSNALIKTWSVLDEAKSWSFADWLKKPRAMWWLAASMALLISAGFILQQVLMMKWLEREIAQQGAPEYALHLDDFLKAAVFGIIVLFIARLIFARLLRFTSAKQLFGRLVIIFSFAAIAFYLLGIALDKLAFLDGGNAWKTIFAVILIFLFTPVFLVLLCVLAIFLSLAMAYVATAILSVGEFVVRRIAEYPKGPVLAVSAFFGGIVALIKALGWN